MFRLAVNGKPSGAVVDLFSGRQGLCVPSDPVSLGTFSIKKGPNQLSVEVVGKAEKSPGFYFGLDGIVLKRQ